MTKSGEKLLQANEGVGTVVGDVVREIRETGNRFVTDVEESGEKVGKMVRGLQNRGRQLATDVNDSLKDKIKGVGRAVRDFSAEKVDQLSSALKKSGSLIKTETESGWKKMEQFSLQKMGLKDEEEPKLALEFRYPFETPIQGFEIKGTKMYVNLIDGKIEIVDYITR